MLFGCSHLSISLYRGHVCAKLHLTATCQAPLSMGFLGKNTGVGCHALLQGIFPTQGWNLRLLTSPVLAGGFFTTSAIWEAPDRGHIYNCTKNSFYKLFNSRKLNYLVESQ